MCVHACIHVCLIGIVSISKRPDSHPPYLCETKTGQLMMYQLPVLLFAPAETERHIAGVSNTVNVFALEVLCVPLINMDIW